jgi:hypothetical protein
MMAGGLQEGEEEEEGGGYGQEGPTAAYVGVEQVQGTKGTYYGSGWAPAGLSAGGPPTWQQQHQQQQDQQWQQWQQQQQQQHHQQRWEDAVEALQAAGLPLGDAHSGVEQQGLTSHQQQQQLRWTAQSGQTWGAAGGASGSVAGSLPQQQQTAAEVEDAQVRTGQGGG